MRRRALIALLAPALVLLGAPSLRAARADGDPASDELVSADVFLPYAPVVSAPARRRLAAIVAGARRAGYPLKVAVIASRQDMGSVGSLFGRPAQYARFLTGEDVDLIHVPILVVMPAGVAVARGGHALTGGALRALRPAAGPGSDPLAALAARAVARQSATAGHPIPARDDVAPSAAPTGAGTGDWVAAASLALLAALGGLGGLAARRRAAPPSAQHLHGQ